MGVGVSETLKVKSRVTERARASVFSRPESHDLPAPEPGKWSARATLTFILVSCSLFWIGVAALVVWFAQRG